MTKVSTKIQGKTLTLEVGYLAKQANGSCVVRFEDTVVLAAVTMGEKVEGANFLPLTVDYREMTYAAGKIPGGFFKREGRPSEGEILTARLVDRAIRPLFPKDFIQEVQVSILVLSSDQENDADIPALIATSAALLISDIPFEKPICACKIGWKDGNFILNPTITELEECDLELVVAGSKEGITMLEGGAKEVNEEILVKAIDVAKPAIETIENLLYELKSQCGKEKVKGIRSPEIPEDFKKRILNEIRLKVAKALEEKSHTLRRKLLKDIKEQTIEKLKISDDEKVIFNTIFDECIKENFILRMKNTQKRIDGRDFDELRAIECKVGVLPRTHGSGVFTRGETQSLATTTLGSSTDMQIMDELEREYKKRFMLHYNFPSFATGEVRYSRGPGRREIGHGALAEKAISPLLPDESQFPYAIRVVSDILESNGSSSMASVCGGCLSLMDAGVPLKGIVAGVAMGMVILDDKKVLLVDIAGEEDHFGCMDLKVAGTEKGITAIQMDLKIETLDIDTFRTALKKAKEARLKIIGKIKEVIPEARKTVSKFAPQIEIMKIKKEKIGLLIGPGGKTIKGIIAETGCEINVDDKGIVTIVSDDISKINSAKQMIEYVVGDVEVGNIYLGKVVKIATFGAFVQIFPGSEGLVHISELAPRRINMVSDIVQEGDDILVKVIAFDEKGRIRLSRKEALRELNVKDEQDYKKRQKKV
ncbi:MAG: polyribonucleotide nucleotidyltransferase [Elusimicrobia bacterium]|nr:polyribonucleotide nucleotidyltransferase [Elusimicrobiota bacterium]